MQIELYPHQKDAVAKLHNGSILWGGVGTGKSLTALVYYYTKVCEGTVGDLGSLANPTDLYVITTAKKRDSLDWQGEAAKLAIGRDWDASVGGATITVDSWNNIGRYEEVDHAFFIFDEQRLVGSGAWTKSFIKIAKRNRWIMLSATPGDTWLDYIPVFIANGFYKNRTEFKREHVVYSPYSKFPKVDHYMGVGRLLKLRNQILVEMPYKMNTVRNVMDVVVDYDHDLFEKVVKKRWHVYENRPLRDVAELFSVMRKVVNSDSSRLEAIQQLTLKHPKLIVFYNFDYELDMLRTLSSKQENLRPLIAPEKNLNRSSDSSQMSDGNGSKNFCSDNTIALTVTENYKEKETCVTGMQAKELIQKPADTESSLLTLKKMGCPSSAVSAAGVKSATNGERDDSTIMTFLTTPGSNKGVNLDVGEHPLKNLEESGALSDTLQIAEWNGHKHEPIPDSERWIYLVQYVAGAEGWNCVTTNAVCFYSLTYSYKIFHQAHGRIDRLNTDYLDLYYYILRSDAFIDKAIMKALLSKKSFNEAKMGADLLKKTVNI